MAIKPEEKDDSKPFNGIHSDYGDFKGLREMLMKAKNGGEDVQEAPKLDPSSEDKEGSFMGEFGADVTPVKMADGGMVPPAPQFNARGAALNMMGASGIPGISDLASIASLSGMANPSQPSMPTPPPQPQMIDPQGVPPPSAPLAPSLTQAAQTVKQAPSTDYSLYKGISAEDRANLYKQLLAQKASGGNLAVQGAAGLGDAIANSFGKGGAHAQDTVRKAQADNVENVIGGVDTQRQQKLQDVQGNQEAALNDPNSSLSTSMRQTLKGAGLNVPSGMSGALMLKIAGPLGELAMKQATLAETASYHKAEAGQRANELQTKEETYRSEHPILNFLNPVGDTHPTSPVSNSNATSSLPQMGQTFNGEKVTGVKRIR